MRVLEYDVHLTLLTLCYVYYYVYPASYVHGDYYYRSMLEEVDFTLEADNLEVFARFLEAEQLTDEATCPIVYRQASSKKVLLIRN